MALAGLNDVLLDLLKDMYDAEKQLVKALPKMAKAASDENLQQAIEEHLSVTRGQVERMENVFAVIGESAKGKKCEAMKGLIAEGEEVIDQKKGSDPCAVDAALIVAAQKVEHYEMAAYGSARAFAEALGFTEAAELLQQTLEEESEANEKLTELAASINECAVEAMGEEDEDEENEEGETVRSGRGGSRTSRSGSR